MDRVTEVWSCSHCGMEIDIRPREMTPGVHRVPSHECPDFAPASTRQWFAWTWEAQGLIREWCSEEDLKALLQSPENYIHDALNPKLKRCNAKWTISVSIDDGRVLLKLS